MIFPYAGRRSVSDAAEHEPRDGYPDGRQQPERPQDRSEQHQPGASPIFIHSSWRASHTWFWLKFRCHSSTVCFYEPFHESLATLTRSEALSLGRHSWNSRHPASEPYYLEFVPLIRKAGGVRLFVPELSYRWFLPVGGPAGDLRPEEVRYLALLMRHAEHLRRIPVFGFTRSLGRLVAIKNKFRGIHIFQSRNLWTQWMSVISYRRAGFNYFLEKMLRVMLEAQGPYFSRLMNRYVVRYLRSLGVEEGGICTTHDNHIDNLIKKLLELISNQDLFILYMGFHIYFYMQARINTDIVVDVTKLVRDKNYCIQVRNQIKSVTGLSMTFDDVTGVQQYHPFDPTLIDWREIRENLSFAISTLDHAFDRRDLLLYGSELIDEALAEIETSEKYVAGARHEIAKMTSERDSVTAASSLLAADRDRLLDQYRAALAGMERQARELAIGSADRGKLITENTRLGSRLAAAIAAADAQASTLAELRSEVFQLTTDRARLTAASERWFNAAVVWAADSLLSTPRLRRGQWLHRLMLRFRGWRIERVNPKGSPRIWANRARDAREWELAARFYVDELYRNVYDPALWVQLGHALREAGKIPAAEIAYRKAATLSKKGAEAIENYTQAFHLGCPPAQRSATGKELSALDLPTEIPP
jgi:hypothetical protein